MTWVKKWDVEGSKGNTYVVSQDENGNFGCSCPEWKFRRNECKHIKYVKSMLEDLPTPKKHPTPKTTVPVPIEWEGGENVWF